jgi:hypothetical protein
LSFRKRTHIEVDGPAQAGQHGKLVRGSDPAPAVQTDRLGAVDTQCREPLSELGLGQKKTITVKVFARRRGDRTRDMPVDGVLFIAPGVEEGPGLPECGGALSVDDREVPFGKCHVA